MRIELGSILDVIDNAEALFTAHFDEIALHKERLILSPDRERYQLLENAGALFTLIVRDDSDAIAGYAVTVVVRHMHYDMLYAQNDVIFLRDDLRRSGVGVDLIRAAEVEAKSRGAVVLAWHAKQGTALERLLPALGYGVQDVVFDKGL